MSGNDKCPICGTDMLPQPRHDCIGELQRQLAAANERAKKAERERDEADAWLVEVSSDSDLHCRIAARAIAKHADSEADRDRLKAKNTRLLAFAQTVLPANTNDAYDKSCAEDYRKLLELDRTEREAENARLRGILVHLISEVAAPIEALDSNSTQLPCVAESVIKGIKRAAIALREAAEVAKDGAK